MTELLTFFVWILKRWRYWTVQCSSFWTHRASLLSLIVNYNSFRSNLKLIMIINFKLSKSTLPCMMSGKWTCSTVAIWRFNSYQLNIIPCWCYSPTENGYTNSQKCYALIKDVIVLQLRTRICFVVAIPTGIQRNRANYKYQNFPLLRRNLNCSPLSKATRKIGPSSKVGSRSRAGGAGKETRPGWSVEWGRYYQDSR